MLRKLLFLAAAALLPFAIATAASAAPARTHTPASAHQQYPPTSAGPTTQPTDVEGTGENQGDGGNVQGADVNAGNGNGSQAGSAGRNGSLPRTGTELRAYVLIGMALIAAGLFALATSTRRRIAEA